MFVTYTRFSVDVGELFSLLFGCGSVATLGVLLLKLLEHVLDLVGLTESLELLDVVPDVLGVGVPSISISARWVEG